MTEFESRIETKVDKLVETVSRLILVEERHLDLAKKVAEISDIAQATDKKVDKWINRGIGVWFVVAAIASIVAAVFFHAG